MLLVWFQKNVRAILLLLLVLLGLGLGQLTATLLGMSLAPPPVSPDAGRAPAQATTRSPALQDFGAILERNIFQAQVGSLTEPVAEQAATTSQAPASSGGPLKLLGTVTRGGASLAMILAGKEVETFRIGDKLPGGGELAEVRRNEVDIRYADGHTETLVLEEAAVKGGAPAPTRKTVSVKTSPQASAPGSQIRQIGENRWEIPRAEADQARSNINELLRQARVEPQIVDGQTTGFVVRMIRPNSLFAMLGLQLGDVLKEVNGITLDSPEKALQIFQQLREARQINISLERGGQPNTFSYEIN